MSETQRDYYIYGNIRVDERSYYLITELGGKLEAAEASLIALRAELAQARAEQQRVETALAEALRQLWQVKEEQRRGEEALRRISGGGCRVVHSGEPKGTTCRDYRQKAIDYPELFGTEYRQRLIDGKHLCASCIADAALASPDAPRREAVGE